MGDGIAHGCDEDNRIITYEYTVPAEMASPPLLALRTHLWKGVSNNLPRVQR